MEVTEDPGQYMAQIEMREVKRAQGQDRLIDRWRIATTDQKITTYDISNEDNIMKMQSTTLS